MPLRASDGQETFIVWRIPTMPERLNAHRALSTVRRDRNIVSRMAGSFADFGELMRGEWSSRYFAEACLWAYQHRLHEEGGWRLSARGLLLARRRGLGLDVNGDLYPVWRQCVARFHAHSLADIPLSVRWILGGIQGEDENTIRHAVATVLDDDTPFRRLGDRSPASLSEFKIKVVRQLVEASGLGASSQALAERIITEELNHQLSRERSVTFARLDPSALSIARGVAASAGREGDARFIFYLFRCFQRIAAFAIDKKVMWRADWLRGAKGNRNAISGASSLQAELSEALHSQVLEVERGHSGRNASATTYRVRPTIEVGTMDAAEAARELGLELTPQGRPRR